jgi:RimJ/RimL family protein N-acetyltransferase
VNLPEATDSVYKRGVAMSMHVSMVPMNTNRLHIRPFELDDRVALYRTIFTDPDVCRFYCGKTKSRGEANEWLTYRVRQSEYGYGWMAVVRQSDHILLGFVALQPYLAAVQLEVHTGTPPHMRFEVELSFAFGRAHWGQGYAYEACQALIEYAFKAVKLPRLVDRIDRRDARSIRLVERLGFRERTNYHPGWDGGATYVLDNYLLR